MIRIEVPKNQDRVALFERAKERARKLGAKLSGSVASGGFSANGVVGTYKTQGDSLEITITKKPFYIPESVIKDVLEKYFKS